MDITEANGWLIGERSMCNSIASDPDGYGLTYEVRLAQADAAMTQQAYWVARANKEGLVLTKAAQVCRDECNNEEMV